MHHGTLLFNTNLNQLENSIKPPEVKISGNAVKSVRTSVTNISNELKNKMSIEEFKFEFQHFLVKFFGINVIYPLSHIEKLEIEKLSQSKYRSWEWNYGYSPLYSFENKGKINDKLASVHFQVKSGLIDELNISFLNDKILSKKIEKQLTGMPHDKEKISHKLNEINYIFEKNNLPVNDIIKLFF